MNEGVPKVGLRNCRPALIPSDNLTADLYMERVKAPNDLHRLGGSNRVAVNVMIDVVHTALREKLSRTVARRSPFPIVQHDLDHDSSTLGLLRSRCAFRLLGLLWALWRPTAIALVLWFISMATYSQGEPNTARPFETALRASSGRTDS